MDRGIVRTVAIAAALFCANASQAAVVTYSFTSSIQDLWDAVYPGPVFKDYKTLTLPIGTVSMGDAIKGSFSYDTSILPTSLQPSNNGYFFYVNALTALSFQVASTNAAYIATPGGQIQAGNSPFSVPGDSFSTSGIIYTPALFQSATITFYDDYGDLINSASLPNFLDLSKTSYARFSYASVVGGSNTQLHLGGKIISLTAVPTVPEPETYAMLLTGLCVMGFVARRRNTALGF